MLKIGLTGGIASGKSTVSAILKRLGAKIIDVDLIAREVVDKGCPCLQEIEKYFGRDILLEDGSLNRKKLRDIVFSDKEKLNLLNSITHSAIISRVEADIHALEKKGELARVVIDAAILIEMGMHKLVDMIWLVKVDREVQIARLIERDGISRLETEDIIDAQMSLEEKAKYAHVIIDNNGTVEELEVHVEQLWKESADLIRR